MPLLRDGEPIEDDWVVLMVDGLRVAFQQAEDFAPPTWPTGERPQQFHLDLTVDEVDAVEPELLALGATKHAVQPGEAAGLPKQLLGRHDNGVLGRE